MARSAGAVNRGTPPPSGSRVYLFALETDQTIIFPWDRKIFQDNQLLVNPLYQDVLEE